MAVLPGHAPVEIVRFPRAISTYDRKAWLSDLSPEWIVTEEHVCFHTLTPRFEPKRPATGGSLRVRLSVQERGEITW